MEEFNRKNHWENIYQTKSEKEMSWYQAKPEISLDFVGKFNLPKTAQIIDIGGGDSLFVDHLLDLGFHHIIVLDISKTAINRAKERLGQKAKLINWIIQDITEFQPTDQYDFWHDRATFHFLTEAKDIETYVRLVSNHLKKDGKLVLGTFSEIGPKKCSGIEIKQYSEDHLTKLFTPYFEKIQCQNIDHKTPFDTTQNFVFCSFTKK